MKIKMATVLHTNILLYDISHLLYMHQWNIMFLLLYIFYNTFPAQCNFLDLLWIYLIYDVW